MPAPCPHSSTQKVIVSADCHQRAAHSTTICLHNSPKRNTHQCSRDEHKMHIAKGVHQTTKAM